MKIQCPCGAKYAFDVSPEMAQTPVRFVCQACGADSSDVVNGLIRQELGVDSLGYLSLDKLLESAQHERGESYCTACFSGKYPTPVDNLGAKNENEA